MKNQTCPVCQHQSREAFTAKVLGKHQAKYYICDNCGLLFAGEPNWLPTAYQNPIASLDTGIVRRNFLNAIRLTIIIVFLFDKRGPFLDSAGGTGMLTRTMRDLGLDYYWEDKYCSNLMALGFERKTNTTYPIATALEVLEHLPEPFDFIRSILDDSGCHTLIFSTTIFENKPPPSNWHYYSFESGQHICFYQRRTLEYIAKKLGMRYLYAGDLHMFTSQPVSSFIYRLLGSRWSLALFPFAKIRLKSLTKSDFLLLRQKTSLPKMSGDDFSG